MTLTVKRTLQGAGLLALLGGVLTVGARTQISILPDAELRRLGTAATATAADHRKLAAHYRAHAAEHQADAATHDAIVAAARKRATDDDAWDLARDAAHYAEHSREAAEALRDLAALHDAMATRAPAR